MKALKIRVRGLVQGVGFRPDVYRLAQSLGLKGYIKNVAGGAVEIWVEGERVEEFVELLKKFPPPARVEELYLEEVKPKGYSKFVILKSSMSKSRSQIPPDLGICEKCLAEILNPFSRRFRYALNSCAKCGPRFSMLYHTPYDRENTSMNDFPLCAECEREYNDPWDRRYHAQGISCGKCGPQVKLLDSEGKRLIVIDPIKEAAKLLDEGFIIAVKGMGGYHLAAKATDDDVVAELRKRKNRPRKPFALMALNYEIANEIVEGLDEELFNSPEAPILLAPKKEPTEISELVAPGHKLLGMMRAYTGLHYLLLKDTKDKFSIMTSANPTGKPTCITKECVIKMGVADYILDHDREIVHRVDDSVIRKSYDQWLFLRRSRGYAPSWIEVGKELGEAIAVGAELQNVGGLSFENKAVLTQYIGDTDELENLEFLEKELNWFIKEYDLKPERIVADMHPYYNTKRLALELSERFEVPLIEVQHHHAHLLSVMAENDIEEAVGLALDGTGYGTDGKIWGGEALLAKRDSFERICHIEYFPLPGGDRATKYPARALLGLLWKAGEDLDKWRWLSKYLPMGENEFEIVKRQVSASIMTSSTGRTLDAFSTLLGISWERSYEGEPAMLLEAFAWGGKLIERIDLIGKENGECVVKVTELLRKVIEYLNKGFSKRDIAYTIQYNLAYNLALSIAEYDLPKVVSGGASVNSIMVKAIKDVLNDVIFPKKVPPGDGGIALGQLYFRGSYSS